MRALEAFLDRYHTVVSRYSDSEGQWWGWLEQMLAAASAASSWQEWHNGWSAIEDECLVERLDVLAEAL